MMSIFVEVGPWVPDPNGGFGKATDSFVFDCGAGVLTNYSAMGISASRMDKVFISHLHADHMSDLSAIYCFGPSDRPQVAPVRLGTRAFGREEPEATAPGSTTMAPMLSARTSGKPCGGTRRASASYRTSYDGLPDSHPAETGDCRAIRSPSETMLRTTAMPWSPFELDWTKYGKVPGDNVAYHNPTTGVKITHFPVIHARKGSMGYKLEWNGLTMIYTSDTRPETRCIDQANNVDPLRACTGRGRVHPRDDPSAGTVDHEEYGLNIASDDRR